MKGIFRITAKNGEELVADQEIPFVPAPGTFLAVTSGGDYMTVDEVYWHGERPDEIMVFMKDNLGEQPAGYLLEQGWRLE